MEYCFTPKFSEIAKVRAVAKISDLEGEIGVYSATPRFVSENCGPISQDILSRVPQWYFNEARELGLYPNIDIRVHRLYPGDYPAYPGWHCDGEFRETYFSQPDLNRIKVHKHITCTVSSVLGGVSCCQFLTKYFSIESSEINQDTPLWRQIDRELAGQTEGAELNTQDGVLYCFDSWTLHRAMPARTRGWRLFFRMAMWHKPNLGDGGMLTKQEQVYQVLGNQGW